MVEDVQPALAAVAKMAARKMFAEIKHPAFRNSVRLDLQSRFRRELIKAMDEESWERE
ncbi:MAG: hypothetical protein K9K69_12840 [Desulfarculaceae bacterium]|nr:hypothetical protein [Desulfarculaceae bacterium]